LVESAAYKTSPRFGFEKIRALDKPTTASFLLR
jgi:hypothetical protein